jgi:hypothetical protein
MQVGWPFGRFGRAWDSILFGATMESAWMLDLRRAT